MADFRVTALSPGDGTAVASLWRDLWILHESWDGYPAAHDPAVYASLADRLEGWAVRRQTDPVLGQHVHLVARDEAGRPVGQVEGWLERHGTHPRTPFTCEVRSLVVTELARGRGVGRLLLSELEALAKQVARGPTFAVAEVLEQNAAYSFYERLGYRPIARTKMLPLPLTTLPTTGRAARPADAMPVARLEMQRRGLARLRGDLRLDPPATVDATFAHSVATHLGRDLDLLAMEGATVLASVSLGIATLEAPFAPVVRAALSRFATHERTEEGVLPLLALAGTRAARRGAKRLEIGDLSHAADDPLGLALARAGARPFSRIVGRLVP